MLAHSKVYQEEEKTVRESCAVRGRKRSLMNEIFGLVNLRYEAM